MCDNRYRHFLSTLKRIASLLRDRNYDVIVCIDVKSGQTDKLNSSESHLHFNMPFQPVYLECSMCLSTGNRSGEEHQSQSGGTQRP